MLGLLLLDIREVKSRKPPKGIESPWSLHIGTFWKIHSINPPEVRDQVVRLIGDRREPVTCNLKILLSAKKVKDKIVLLLPGRVAHFQTKYCMFKENPKNKITGSTKRIPFSNFLKQGDGKNWRFHLIIESRLKEKLVIAGRNKKKAEPN